MKQGFRWGFGLAVALSMGLVGCGPVDAEVNADAEGTESRADGLVVPNSELSWFWGNRSLPSVSPASFEGPAAIVPMRLPASGDRMRVRASFSLPREAGTPLAFEAWVQTRPTYRFDEMGPSWFWSQKLTAQCTNGKCWIDQTVSQLPTAKGTPVYFNLYAFPGNPDTSVEGTIFSVSFEVAGQLASWPVYSSTETVGGRSVHLARAVHSDVAAKLTTFAAEGSARYRDALPPGSTDLDDVCVYLVNGPSSGLGYESAPYVWVGARPGNALACPKPKNLTGSLSVRDLVIGTDRLLVFDETSLSFPAGASPSATWSLVVQRLNGSGQAVLSSFELRRPESPWSCGKSTHRGQQYWTCREGTLNRCFDGFAVAQECHAGCMIRPSGQDDLCVEPAPTWSCGSSSHRGKQYWTCNGGNLYRCDSVNGPTVVRCPFGCKVLPSGTDDRCKSP